MLVVAYMRYSSENQRDGYSIEAQQKAIREYCERKNWTIVREYIDEARSGTTDNREQFQAMISDAPNGHFEGVVVHKFDRFSRDKYDNAIYKRELRNYGIRVYSVLEELDDSPESLILETLLEGMAQYYSENLAREVKKGLTVKAQKGDWCGGRPPYGYVKDEKNPDKLVIEPHEAEVVKQIFDWFTDGMTILSICDKLNAMGERTKQAAHIGGVEFKYSTVRRMLSNEKYIGTFLYRKTQKVKTRTGCKYVKQKDENLIVVENAIPPIIDEAIWLEIRRRLDALPHHPQRAKVDYLLNGYMFCEECGAEYVGGGCSSHTKKNGEKVQYHFYVCRNAKKHTCSNVKVSKERIEQACINAIIEYCYDDDNIVKFSKEVLRRYEQSRNDDKRKIAEYQAEIKRLDAQKQRLVTLALDGVLSPAETREQKEKIELKIDEAVKNLKAVSNVSKPTVDDAIEFMRSVKSDIIQGKCDYKELIYFHINKVKVSPEKIEISLFKLPHTQNPLDGDYTNEPRQKKFGDTEAFSEGKPREPPQSPMVTAPPLIA